jgi:glucose/mannose-6-phosphate isomerase
VSGDPSGMLDDVLAQPDQIEDALWRVEAAGVPRRDHEGGFVVAGMGGSAIGADLAAAAIGDRAARPILTNRGYTLPGWLGGDSLVLFASYSGETEETLSAYEQARELGIPRLALTTGGQLSERARDDGVPVIGVPSGMQPRAAVIYMTVAALECAAACGAAPSLRREIEACVPTLRAITDDDSGPRWLADALRDRIPVVYGAGRTAAPAVRWKCQLNENAEVAAFANELPEADHNEVCGLDERLTPVFLDDDTLDRRLRRRIDVTRQVMGGGHVVEARGQTPVERVLSLVLVGDLVSVHLALLRGVDPTPVDTITELKRRLAG